MKDKVVLGIDVVVDQQCGSVYCGFEYIRLDGGRDVFKVLDLYVWNVVVIVLIGVYF